MTGKQGAALAAVVLWAGLALFGARVHWVEEIGSAERDGYVAQAEALLAGEPPSDPFRPPFFAYAIALATPVAGDTFTAARAIANLSAVALALLALGFANRLAPPEAPPEHARRAGLGAFALVAVNPNTWILGQHASTDMLFAAFAGGAALAAMAYLARPHWATAAGAGLLWAMAAMTRGNASLLLPGLVAGWWMARPQEIAGTASASSRRHRLPHLALAAAVACLALLPHWILRARTFGSPFYDENWKNLAWKLDGYPDWSRLAALPATGSFGSLVVEHPAAVLQGAVSEVSRFVAGGASQLFGTWVHAVVFLIGAVLCWRARPRLTGWLLGTVLFFFCGVAGAFFTWGRLLLLLLPVGAACGAAGLVRAPWPRQRRWMAQAGLTALIVLLAVKTAGFRLPAFVNHHPYDDVAALRELEPALDRGQALAGTSPFLERYLHRPYVAIPDAFGDDVRDGGAYTKRLVSTLRRRRVAYLVVGTADLRDRPPALLGAGAAPEGLALVSRTPRLTVWKVLPETATR